MRILKRVSDSPTQLFNSKEPPMTVMGYEIAWDSGDSGNSIAIEREDFIALFKTLGCEIDDLNLVECLADAIAIDWIEQLGLGGHKLMVRSLRTDVAGVYKYIVDKETRRGSWSLRLRVALINDRPSILPVKGLEEDDGTKRIALAIVEFVENCQSTVYNREIDRALVKLGNRVGWVNRLEDSRISFVLPDDGKLFTRAFTQLRKLSDACVNPFRGYAIPQYSDPVTREAWRVIAGKFFLNAVKKIEKKQIAMIGESVISPIAYQARLDELEILFDHASKYSRVIGGAHRLMIDRALDLQEKLRYGKRIANKSVAQLAKVETSSVNSPMRFLSELTDLVRYFSV